MGQGRVGWVGGWGQRVYLRAQGGREDKAGNVIPGCTERENTGPAQEARHLPTTGTRISSSTFHLQNLNK